MSERNLKSLHAWRVPPGRGGLVVLALLVCQPARADEPPSQPSFDYQSMLKSGATHFEHGDHVAAIGTWERLLQSMGEERGWKVLYNLGLAYEAVGDATLAMERFGAFVRALEASPEASTPALAERRADAVERMGRIRASHGEVHVRAAPGVVVLVRVDKAPERPAGFTAWLTPGEHRIEIGCGTDSLRQETIRVQAGESTEVLTAREPRETPPPTASPSVSGVVVPLPARSSAPPSKPRPFPTLWVVAGAGATMASAVLPLVLAARARSKRDDAIALGPGHTQYESAYDEYETARRQYEISYALPATFAVATLGIVGYHMLRSGGSSPVKATASVSNGGGVLWASGSF